MTGLHRLKQYFTLVTKWYWYTRAVLIWENWRKTQIIKLLKTLCIRPVDNNTMLRTPNNLVKFKSRRTRINWMSMNQWAHFEDGNFICVFREKNFKPEFSVFKKIASYLLIVYLPLNKILKKRRWPSPKCANSRSNRLQVGLHCKTLNNSHVDIYTKFQLP